MISTAVRYSRRCGTAGSGSDASMGGVISMRRGIFTLVAGLAVLGTAGGVYVTVSPPGGEEEVLPQAGSGTRPVSRKTCRRSCPRPHLLTACHSILRPG